MNMSNNVIMNTLNVPIINDFEHLAEQLSLTKELLYFLTYKKQRCYTRKEIPKKDGTKRTLYVPHLALKVVQRWILKEILETDDVAVIIEGTHSCMTARGIKKNQATTKTYNLSGRFKDDVCLNMRLQ